MQSQAAKIRVTRYCWIPTCPFVPTPKRPGAPLDTSSNEGRRASRDPDETSANISLADFGLPASDDKNLRLAVNREDRERAIQYPTLGRPRFARLYRDNAAAHLTRKIFDSTPP